MPILHDHSVKKKNIDSQAIFNESENFLILPLEHYWGAATN